MECRPQGPSSACRACFCSGTQLALPNAARRPHEPSPHRHHSLLPTHLHQVDFHSFEGILYTTPGLGWLVQHGLRGAISAWMIGGANLAARVWPLAEALLGTVLQKRSRVETVKAWAARVWWRQAPPAAWRHVPAPYDPRL